MEPRREIEAEVGWIARPGASTQRQLPPTGHGLLARGKQRLTTED